MTADTRIQDFTINQILWVLASTKKVEKIISNFQLNAKEDITQNIYLSLLEKDPATLKHLFESDQIDFYIAKMVTNNVKSTVNNTLRGRNSLELKEWFNYLPEDNTIEFLTKELIEKAIKSIPDWYIRDMAERLWIKKQTATYINHKTSIPIPAITRAKKEARQYIKVYLDIHNPNIN